MSGIAGVRLTCPKATPGGLVRQELLDTILQSPKRLIYIHAGAGYGKTTLLAQIAGSYKIAVWISLDGKNEIFTFVGLLSEAVGRVFQGYRFSTSEFMPFEGRENFITLLANAFLNSLEKLSAALPSFWMTSIPLTIPG
ncbi:hypothetical protein [Candidatus Formimonas warabiya]|uniref:Uncharacterized protein n=1 Tax=Formimonas warabiya TaxID=1761012 RepID=A0A3G1KMH6_FORW1|nr:hypothetical protein [Candidatus Formimonas warabiya]ATW23614.1 hypothetical protein DCMF_01300 [Candidatus Formimonas warabiya]